MVSWTPCCRIWKTQTKKEDTSEGSLDRADAVENTKSVRDPLKPGSFIEENMFEVLGMDLEAGIAINHQVMSPPRGKEVLVYGGGCLRICLKLS